MKKRALIIGINGQDGSYLAKLLLEKNYKVYGTIKRNSIVENQTTRIDDIRHNIQLYYADLLDMPSLETAVKESQPNEIYNLAAQSHVGVSFIQPIYTIQTIVLGTLHLLEIIKTINLKIKFYQASSSEMFGMSIDPDGFQRESTPMHPISPYACAKLNAHHLVQCYRKSYNLFACNGILFNHESPLRGLNFVSSKVVVGAVKIKCGLEKNLRLGNLIACRDWGHAMDYVRAMWMILQTTKPDDYVCAMGETRSVKKLCEYVFSKLNMDYRKYVICDKRYFRPMDVLRLKGDASKLRQVLGWAPKYTFETMLDEMIDYWFKKYCK